MTEQSTERVVYSGRVQGVGFRYTVRSLAARLPVAGFVRNLPNGTVELLVQGSTKDISSLLDEVAAHFQRHIRHCERGTIVTPEVFQSFDIRF